MSEAILFLVIAALCGLLGYERYEGRKERAKLVNALMARNAQELANLELAGQTKIEVKPPQDDDDYTEVGNLNDKDFDKYALDKEEDE